MNTSNKSIIIPIIPMIYYTIIEITYRIHKLIRFVSMIVFLLSGLGFVILLYYGRRRGRFGSGAVDISV